MPDLSHRPSRYATALVAVAVVGGYVVTATDVRIGPDPALTSVQEENEVLEQRVEALADSPAPRTCAAFPDQETAQAWWAPNARAYPDWDGNGNGKVCEQLRSSAPESATVRTVVARPTPAATRTAAPAPAPAPVPAPRPSGATRTADPAPQPSRNCASFPDQESAQAWWTPNARAYPSWDGNGNGQVCEQLRSRAPQDSPAPAPQPAPRPAPSPSPGPAPSGGGATAQPQPVAQRTCSAFPNQEAAQAYWDADPSAHPDWDGNGNGVVCEQLRSQDPEVVTRVVTRTVPRPQATPTPSPTPPPSEPPTPDPLPSPVERPTAPSKATIVASREHFGLYAATTEEYDGLEATLARDTSLQGWFQGWNSDFRPERVNAAWTRGEVPLLVWEARAFGDGLSSAGYTLTSISEGVHDSYLRQYARDIAANGLPLVIRMNPEMNGDWYRWAEPNPDFDNPPGSYVAAWRHIHDLFAEEGANDLVIWLWSPNRIDNISRLPPIDDYYPGDDYVDWVGMTGYYRPEDEAPTFASTYDATLAELRRVAPGKPIILSEVGATESGGRKPEFIADFFAGLPRNPDVIGFLWFNYVVTEDGRTNDWRVQSSREVTDAFRAGLYASGYGRDRGKQPRLVTTPPPPPPATPTPPPETTTAPPG